MQECLPTSKIKIRVQCEQCLSSLYIINITTWFELNRLIIRQTHILYKRTWSQMPHMLTSEVQVDCARPHVHVHVQISSVK